MAVVRIRRYTAILLAANLLPAGCGIVPTEDPGYIAAEKRLSAARADPAVRESAAAVLEEAGRTLQAAKEAEDRRQLAHRVYMTEKKVDVARAIAERRIGERQLQELRQRANRQTENTRLAQDVERERLAMALREARAARERTEALRSQLSEIKALQTAQGRVLTLSDVLFESSKASLNPDAKRALEPLVNFLREKPERRIVIEGFTDNSGSSEENLELSLARANAVKTYLVNEGIDGNRVSTIGRGHNFPLVSNDTMAGRQRNRRVEIVIEPEGGPLGDVGPLGSAAPPRDRPTPPGR